MASTVTCKYCGAAILTSDQNCPNCGAANEQYVDDSPSIITDPKTIEELKEYCAERGMPLLKMRFFIGEDFKEAKAFGIYREADGKFVVYKNKADGSRAVRYRGYDEAFAVGELYQKLLDECHNRGIYPDGRPEETQKAAEAGKTASAREKLERLGPAGQWYATHIMGGWLEKILVFVLILIVVAFMLIPALLVFVAPLILIPLGIVKIARKKWSKKAIAIWLAATLAATALMGGTIRGLVIDAKFPQGYYSHDGSIFYRYAGTWYEPGLSDWRAADVPGEILSEDYLEGGYLDDWDFIQFTDSETYAELEAERESRESGSDYDSWDSGSTDWSSDW